MQTPARWMIALGIAFGAASTPAADKTGGSLVAKPMAPRTTTPGTTQPNWNFVVPVRLTDMSPSLRGAVVECRVEDRSGNPMGATTVAIPVAGGNYNSRLTIPVVVGQVRAANGSVREALATTVDPTLARVWACNLLLLDERGGTTGVTCFEGDASCAAPTSLREWNTLRRGSTRTMSVTGSF